MLFSLRDTHGNLFYLIKDKQYTIGRKDCDITIANDQSISRKHALLTAKNDTVILIDCGSKYNTFIDTVKIEPHRNVDLHAGIVIRFGMLSSIYTLEKCNLITMNSGLKGKQKLALNSNLNFLGGSISTNWDPDITHITVNELMWTVKVLCGVITGTPIVTTKFWDDYIDKVKHNLPPPNITDYKPPHSATMINCQQVSLDFKEERRALFKNKMFVFPSIAEKEKLIDIIKLTGGEAVSWEESVITRDVITKSTKEYIILHTNQYNMHEKYIINYLKEVGERPIPFLEIALAIINCCCEKDCNPKFDRMGTVLGAPTQAESQKPSDVLATVTQTQAPPPVVDDIKTEVFPASLIEIDESQVVINDFFDCRIAELPVEHVEMPEEGIKRKSEWSENVMSKKTKIEPLFAKSSMQREEIQNNRSYSCKSKHLFSFGDDEEEEKKPLENKELVMNPFSKKRPSEAVELNEKPPKKPAVTIPSSTLIDDNIMTSVIDISRIDRIDFSGAWISKSTCNKNTSIREDFDDEMKEYIEQFKNTVIVEKECMIITRSSRDYSDVTFTKPNFKKFKKVLPLKMQTTIYPESKYIDVICNTTANDVVIPQAESSDDENDGMSIPCYKSRGRKRFNF